VVGPAADLWGIAPVFLAGAVVVFGVWLAGRKARMQAGERHRVVTQKPQPLG